MVYFLNIKKYVYLLNIINNYWCPLNIFFLVSRPFMNQCSDNVLSGRGLPEVSKRRQNTDGGASPRC